MLASFDMLYPIINYVIMCVGSMPNLNWPWVTIDTKRLRVLKDWDFLYNRELEDWKLEGLILHLSFQHENLSSQVDLWRLLLRLDGSFVERLWQVFNDFLQLYVKLLRDVEGLSSTFFLLGHKQMGFQAIYTLK